MSKNAEYASQYSEAAMEAMRQYGIPASVTLAQGILESANGQSELTLKGNNHFGIKAGGRWLKNGGEYLVYDDDKKNEKFCKYNSATESYKHHSQFLLENNRYASCFKLSPDDYMGWTKGLAKAGYSTTPGYDKSLQEIIRLNGFDKYDKQVMQEMKAQGKKFGVENNQQPTQAKAATTPAQAATGEYSFPVKREDFLFITSAFGMRTDPMDKTKQQFHKGIDIKCKADAVLACENNGKVVAVNHNANTDGGKSVTIEYERPDGSKVQNIYMHLSDISVKKGDNVNAGQKLGVSGNTGFRTTGEHLHFSVKVISAEGKTRDLDPAAYLAEVAQKGNIKQQAQFNGTDLLAKYKGEGTGETVGESPEAWMKKLLSSEDSGVKMEGGDPIVNMAITMFTSLMVLASQVDAKSEEEQKARISQAVDSREIDLTTVVKGMKECKLTVGSDGRATLSADNGATKVTRDITNAEMNKLQTILGDEDLSREGKQIRIAGLVNNIVLSRQASVNYDNIVEQSRQQQQTVSR